MYFQNKCAHLKKNVTIIFKWSSAIFCREHTATHATPLKLAILRISTVQIELFNIYFREGVGLFSTLWNCFWFTSWRGIAAAPAPQPRWRRASLIRQPLRHVPHVISASVTYLQFDISRIACLVCRPNMQQCVAGRTAIAPWKQNKKNKIIIPWWRQRANAGAQSSKRAPIRTAARVRGAKRTRLRLLSSVDWQSTPAVATSGPPQSRDWNPGTVVYVHILI